MTAVDDRRTLGEERRLIFQNVANGVPIERIGRRFHRSEPEIWREVEFVGRKIREYRFRCLMPPIECQGLRAIRINRAPLLETLEKLGVEYLASELLIPNIGVQKLDHPAIIKEAGQRVHARVREVR